MLVLCTVQYNILGACTVVYTPLSQNKPFVIQTAIFLNKYYANVHTAGRREKAAIMQILVRHSRKDRCGF